MHQLSELVLRVCSNYFFKPFSVSIFVLFRKSYFFVHAALPLLIDPCGFYQCHRSVVGAAKLLTAAASSGHIRFTTDSVFPCCAGGSPKNLHSETNIQKHSVSARSRAVFRVHKWLNRSRKAQVSLKRHAM